MNAITWVACEAEIRADVLVRRDGGVSERLAYEQTYWAWVEALDDASKIWAEEERLGL